MIITKEVFVTAIEALRQQTAFDRAFAAAVSEMFQCEAGMYKNELLKTSTIKLLQLHFPPVDGHCEIEHYCWGLNFGKVGDNDVITPEDLYDKLILDVVHIKEWLPLNDPSAIHYEVSGEEVDKKFEEVIKRDKEAGGNKASFIHDEAGVWPNSEVFLQWGEIIKNNPGIVGKTAFAKSSPDETI